MGPQDVLCLGLDQCSDNLLVEEYLVQLPAAWLRGEGRKTGQDCCVVGGDAAGSLSARGRIRRFLQRPALRSVFTCVNDRLAFPVGHNISVSPEDLQEAWDQLHRKRWQGQGLDRVHLSRQFLAIPTRHMPHPLCLFVLHDNTRSTKTSE